MGLQLWDELNQTNAAYCKALGLDASQYETPLSPEEAEIAEAIKAGREYWKEQQ